MRSSDFGSNFLLCAKRKVEERKRPSEQNLKINYSSPFFFSQKKSGKKENYLRQLADTSQDKSSTRSLKFPEMLKGKLVGNFLTLSSFNLYLGIPLVRGKFLKPKKNSAPWR